MKNLKYLIITLLLAGGFQACTDEWDNHYSQGEIEVDNENIEIVEMSIAEYLASQSQYQQMTALFDEFGIMDSIAGLPNLKFSVFVVENSAVGELPDVESQRKYAANMHISTVEKSPANMKDGETVAMWSGKFVPITKETAGNQTTILLNESQLLKTIKTDNGYVHVMSERITAPQSMLEMLESLGDDYSIFKKMIFDKQERVFDKENSRIKGVDETGNTVYDTLWTYRFPYFEDWKGVDFANEEATYTIFISSDELIENALAEARAKLDSWNMEREDSILYNWIFQAAIFKKEFTREEFENPAEPDLNMTYATPIYNENGGSAFGKQWRPSVNQLDLDHPVELSNGTAYYVKSLKIPTNVLIYRIKEDIIHYQYFNDVQKECMRRSPNLIFYAAATWRHENAATSVPGWPTRDPYGLQMLWDGNTDDYITTFELDMYHSYDSETNTFKDLALPAGEYTFHVGYSGANSGRMGSDVKVFLNDKLIREESRLVTATWTMRDRTGGGWPEFFPPSLSSTYDRDGQEMGTYTVTGNQPESMTMKLVNDFTDRTSVYLGLVCWCFRPTKDCY